MKHILILILLFIVSIFYSCETVSEDENNTNIQHNFIQLKIGDKWLYRDLFINVGISEFKDYPDTLIRYSFIEAIKDTVIDSTNFIIIEGLDYSINKLNIDSFPKRYAVSINDSECVSLSFKDSNYGLMGGPLCKLQSLNIKIHDGMSQNELRSQFIDFKINAQRDFDTTTFKDKVYPLVFPLVIDEPWYYRTQEDADIGGITYRKKYLGKDTITIDSICYNAYKCEMLVSEAFGENNNITFFQWYSEIGMLQEYLDYGLNRLTDESGNLLRAIHTSQVIEYIGNYSINPDTLKPWGL